MTKMSLSKRQFDLLVHLVEHGPARTQRELAHQASVSAQTIKKILTELGHLGLVRDGCITQAGIGCLEHYRVKRAIFIAAGFGSRLVPITLNTPKPLIRVKGKPMIETSLDAIIAVGIKEIYIVRGYLSEQFDQLLYKYPHIKFIENPDYHVANSIMSAVCAKEHFGNAYVLDADLILLNPSLIKKYQYSANYLGIPTQRTDDWCFVNRNGRITNISLGGVNCHQWVGISYWTQEDGEKLAVDLVEKIKQPGGKEVFWDDVPLKSYKEHYNVGIRSCSERDVVEVDTFGDLKRLDPSYDVR